MVFRPQRKYVPILIHVLLWFFFAGLLFAPPFGGRITMPEEYWLKQAILFILLAFSFYLNWYVLIPQLLFKDKIIPYVLSLIGLVATIYWTIQGVEAWLNLPELWQKAVKPNAKYDPRHKRFDMFTFLYSLIAIGISTSVASVQKWQKDAEIRKDLEKDKLNVELSLLKAQINPHFFFNTLNNIYALTLIDIEAAREALHKLSRMMRYVLYDTQAGMVSLKQELSFLEDYIQLMQLRLTDKVKVHYNKPTTIQDVEIAPMLLLPYIENAFKHGISATQPSDIFINIEQNNGKLAVEIRNTKFAETSRSLETSNGIGLVNTRRRLDLLYAHRYQLAVVEQSADNEFIVKLVLDT